jgi:cupin superfamily acireductone dioxygenase involved in methionine salvage
MSIQTSAIERSKRIIKNKDVRNITVLVLTFLVILVINSLLPIIEGSMHYTEDPVTVTYAEYKIMNARDTHCRLTWQSQRKVDEYIETYITNNAHLPDDERYIIEPPDAFVVDVYTKFFFQHAFWYLSTIISVVSAVLLYYSLFNYLISKLKRSKELYLDLDAQLVKLADKSLDPVTFEPWMHHTFNHNRKVDQHIANVRQDIDKLNRRTHYMVRLELEDNPDTVNPKCIKYKHKLYTLNSYLESSYITKYIPYIRVKHFRYIHPLFVTSGYNVSGTVVDTFSSIRTNKERLVRDSMIKIITTIGLTLMFSLIITFTILGSFGRPWYWVLLDILVKIAPLIIQVPLAYDYCHTYMDEQLIPTLYNRRSIAFLYLAYVQEPRPTEEEVDGNENQS